MVSLLRSDPNWCERLYVPPVMKTNGVYEHLLLPLDAMLAPMLEVARPRAWREIAFRSRDILMSPPARGDGVSYQDDLLSHSETKRSPSNGGACASARKLRVHERGAEGALLGFGSLRLGKFYNSAEAVAAAAAAADDVATDNEDGDSSDDSDDDTGGGLPYMRKRPMLKVGHRTSSVRFRLPRV